MNEFDPYLVWLDIPPHHRPPQPWRLLRVGPDCRDEAVICQAAQAALTRVEQASAGQHAQWAAQISAEIRQAEQSLLHSHHQPPAPDSPAPATQH